MNILQRYLLRQVIASLVLTVIVFTFVLMLGNALREILPLLVRGEVGLGVTLEALGLLIPFVLAVALPMAMLTATLLVFGRFSADQELTAARASGLSLVSLVGPVLVLSLLLCGVSAAVNLEVAPGCRVAYNNLRSQLKAAAGQVKLPAGRFMEFPGKPGFIIYVGKNKKGDLQDVLLYRFEDGTNLSEIVRAPSGQVSLQRTNHLLLRLDNANAMMLPSGLPGYGRQMAIDLDMTVEKSDWKPGISDMTFEQLQAQLRELERRVRLPLPPQPSPAGAARANKRAARLSVADLTEPIRIQMHRQLAFSFACFGFTLMGIPLAIRVQRRETNIGVAIALGLVLVYYLLLLLVQSLGSHPALAPHVLMWAPDFIFQAAGAVLLWRANRGI